MKRLIAIALASAVALPAFATETSFMRNSYDGVDDVFNAGRARKDGTRTLIIRLRPGERIEHLNVTNDDGHLTASDALVWTKPRETK